MQDFEVATSYRVNPQLVTHAVKVVTPEFPESLHSESAECVPMIA